MQAATPVDRVGSALGRHRLTDLLHTTSARAIYRAEEEGSGRLVLLMVLDEHVAAHPVVRERFDLRMRQAADVLERHLVPLRQWGVVDGLLCAELGLLAGTGLRTLLEHEPLEPARALSVLDDLADAVDAAHSRGLAHLGLSPTAVVVGGDGTARLTDLGLSALLAEAGILPDPQDRSYRAPDQPAHVDPASTTAAALDVWSLNALLHDSLTGTGAAARPVRVPPRLATLVHRGARGHRWTAAAEMARAARAALADDAPPVVLRPRTSPLPTGTPGTPVRPGDEQDLDATAFRAVPPLPPAAPHPRGTSWSATTVTGGPPVRSGAAGAAGASGGGSGPGAVIGPGSTTVPLVRHPPSGPGPGRQVEARPRRSLAPVVALVLVALALLTTLALAWILVDPLGGAAPGPTSLPSTSSATSGPGSTPAPEPSPSTTASPSPDEPTSPPALPAGATVCEPVGGPVGGLRGSAAGSTNTSCGFAEATRAGLGAEPDPFEVGEIEVTSPVTGEDYTLTCSSEDGLITCTGGENAVVLVW